MDAKLLLVQAIALLYWDSKKTENKNENKEMIKELIASVKLPENILDTDNGRDNLINLKYTAEDLLEQQEEINGAVLSQRLRLSIKDDEELVRVAVETIEENEDSELRCVSYQNNIRHYFEAQKFTETLKKFMSEALYSGKAINARKLSREFISKLEPFASVDTGEGTARENPLVVKGGSLNDTELLAKQFKEAIEQINQEGLMQTGYKGFNRMLHVGGLIRGDCYVWVQDVG